MTIKKLLDDPRYRGGNKAIFYAVLLGTLVYSVEVGKAFVEAIYSIQINMNALYWTFQYKGSQADFPLGLFPAAVCLLWALINYAWSFYSRKKMLASESKKEIKSLRDKVARLEAELSINKKNLSNALKR